MSIQSAEEFVRLRTSEDPADYRRAAEEEAPVAVWFEVIEHHLELRRWVAHNKTVPVVVLEQLSVDPDPEVRWAVVVKRKASPTILERLASDPEDDIRLRVALHSNTPVTALRTLSHDAWDQVRHAAADRLEETGGGR